MCGRVCRGKGFENVQEQMYFLQRIHDESTWWIHMMFDNIQPYNPPLNGTSEHSHAAVFSSQVIGWLASAVKESTMQLFLVAVGVFSSDNGTGWGNWSWDQTVKNYRNSQKTRKPRFKTPLEEDASRGGRWSELPGETRVLTVGMWRWSERKVRLNALLKSPDFTIRQKRFL